MNIPKDCSMGSTVILILFVLSWIAGIVIAKGFWITCAAIFMFPFSWYLVIEKIMQLTGIV